ncbi:MAG: hypothetical protein ACPLXC_02735 [Candidatus Pacearchaeota archaeon]
MILDNAFDISSVKELIKIVVNEAKDLAYVISVEHGGNSEKLKKHAIVFLLKEEDSQNGKTSRAQKIEETLEMLEKNPNYNPVYATLLNSYNYIRKVAGKEEYKALRQENPSR